MLVGVNIPNMDYAAIVVIANVIDLVWVGGYCACIHSCDGNQSKIGIEGSSIIDMAMGFKFLFGG